MNPFEHQWAVVIEGCVPNLVEKEWRFFASSLMVSDGQVLIFLSNLRTVPRARLSC